MDELEPITLFTTPDFVSITSVDMSALYPVAFALAFFIWLAFTLIIAYHWFRYSHRSTLTVPALALHVVVSGTLMLISASGLR